MLIVSCVLNAPLASIQRRKETTQKDSIGQWRQNIPACRADANGFRWSPPPSEKSLQAGGRRSSGRGSARWTGSIPAGRGKTQPNNRHQALQVAESSPQAGADSSRNALIVNDDFDPMFQPKHCRRKNIATCTKPETASNRVSLGQRAGPSPCLGPASRSLADAKSMLNGSMFQFPKTTCWPQVRPDGCVDRKSHGRKTKPSAIFRMQTDWSADVGHTPSRCQSRSAAGSSTACGPSSTGPSAPRCR